MARPYTVRVLIILIELDSTDCPQQYDFAYVDQKKRRDLGIAILPMMIGTRNLKVGISSTEQKLSPV